MKFIKTVFGSVFSLVFSLFATACVVVLIGMAVGFWFWFAKVGFDAATQLMGNFL